MTELRPIPSCPGYFAGADGSIYSVKTRGPTTGKVLEIPRKLKPGSQKSGYLFVQPVRSGKKTVPLRVHRLVCEAWHGSCPEGSACSHLDGNRTNNRPENLCWETLKENHRRKNEHGTHDRGTQNSRAVLTPSMLRKIRKMLQQGRTTYVIAEMLGVSRTTISRVKNGRRYQDD